MGVAHVGLAHRDPYRCKVKGFRAVSSTKRSVSKRHLQGVQHSCIFCGEAPSLASPPRDTSYSLIKHP